MVGGSGSAPAPAEERRRLVRPVAGGGIPSSAAILSLVDASSSAAPEPDRAVTIASATSGANDPDRRGGTVG